MPRCSRWRRSRCRRPRRTVPPLAGAPSARSCRRPLACRRASSPCLRRRFSGRRRLRARGRPPWRSPRRRQPRWHSRRNCRSRGLIGHCSSAGSPRRPGRSCRRRRAARPRSPPSRGTDSRHRNSSAGSPAGRRPRPSPGPPPSSCRRRPGRSTGRSACPRWRRPVGWFRAPRTGRRHRASPCCLPRRSYRAGPRRRAASGCRLRRLSPSAPSAGRCGSRASLRRPRPRSSIPSGSCWSCTARRARWRNSAWPRSGTASHTRAPCCRRARSRRCSARRRRGPNRPRRRSSPARKSGLSCPGCPLPAWRSRSCCRSRCRRSRSAGCASRRSGDGSCC